MLWIRFLPARPATVSYRLLPLLATAAASAILYAVPADRCDEAADACSSSALHLTFSLSLVSLLIPISILAASVTSL